MNEWLCNVQLFPKVWISKYIEKISSRYPVPVWKQFLDIRIRLQTHYSSGYPTGKPDSDHLCCSVQRWADIDILTPDQRWPESIFQPPTPLLFQNFWIRTRIRLFYKFENPTPVQNPATIIHPTVIYHCFYLRNYRTDSCYCRNGKVTPDPGPVFHKFLTPDPGPKKT